MARDLGVDALHHSLIEALHVLGREGRVERYQLVEDTAERPDVTLGVVGFVLPDLWRSVVRRASLGLENARLSHFGNVEVSQLNVALLCQEDVGALDVSVDDLLLMQRLQAQNHLVKD